MNGRNATALKCLGAAIAIALAAGSPAHAQEHSWLLPDLANAAKAEGALTVYGSMNEQEALPLWKVFEDATGVKVSYVRSSDTQIMAKVAIENRAGQHTWDIAFTTTVPPNRSATPRASSGWVINSPRGTVTPNFARICFA